MDSGEGSNGSLECKVLFSPLSSVWQSSCTVERDPIAALSARFRSKSSTVPIEIDDILMSQITECIRFTLERVEELVSVHLRHGYVNPSVWTEFMVTVGSRSGWL